MDNTKVIKDYFKQFKKINNTSINKFSTNNKIIIDWLDKLLVENTHLIDHSKIILAISKDVDIFNLPKCLHCNNSIDLKRVLLGYKFCSRQCSNKSNIPQQNRNKTCLLKFGIDNVFKLKEYQQKRDKTCLEKYGDIYPYRSNLLIQEKYKQTCLSRFGTEYPLSNKIIQNKTRQTMLDNYGVMYSQQSNVIKQTIENNNLNKYGFIHQNNIHGWNRILSWKDYIVPLFDKSQYIGFNQLYQWKCIKCNNIFESSIYTTNFHQLDMFLPRCLNCYPYCENNGISKKEKQLLDFVKSIYKYNIIENDRELIKPFELDIVIPQLKIAIEFNGDYWHDVNHKPNDYHLNKTLLCEQLGYRLIHIFEYQWNNKTKLKLYKLLTNQLSIKDNHNTLYIDRCWYSLNDIPNKYNIQIIKPQLNKNIFNCGYIKCINKN